MTAVMKAKWKLLVAFTIVIMAVALNTTYAAKSRQPNQITTQQPGRPRQAQIPAGTKVERDIVYARVGNRKLLLNLCLPTKVTKDISALSLITTQQVLICRFADKSIQPPAVLLTFQPQFYRFFNAISSKRQLDLAAR